MSDITIVEEAIERIQSMKYKASLYKDVVALRKAEEALKNQKSIIEELEKIKEKIQGLIDFEDSCSGNTTLGYQCLGVVEDRISELKGENNDHT